MAKYQMILTARQSDYRFKETDRFTVFNSSEDDLSDIIIDTTKRYQTIIGFGGAFTEAAAYTLDQMSDDKRQEVIDSYFDQGNGLGYTMGRVHIHSSDFSLGNYTYIDEGDVELETFNISRDYKWVIPLIKDAMKVSGTPISLLASPWSPPAWMKTNGDMNNGGRLLPEYKETWAKYYTKFIQAYRKEGLNIWGISVQNEPDAVQVWDSCLYSAEEERDFVKDYLGPVLQNEHLQDVNIIIWDHNRDVIVERASIVLEDPETAKYVWGTGLHWYVSEEFENVGEVHHRFPDKHLLFTEGCQEGGVQLGEWFTGERYGRNIIGDLNQWVEGYLDWNLVLNEEGGPNHVGNYCDAPIIADTKTNRVHYNSSYYYIGHFSKYIKPGADRIGLDVRNTKILSTGFLNKDGSIVIVLMNETDDIIPFRIKLEENICQSTLPEHSIITLIIQK